MRKCYIISYDLRSGGDYDALYAAIKAYGAWAHITESLWAITTEESAKDVRENLLQHMKEKDRLFVVRSGVEGAWMNVMCRNTWLKENL